jgi:outer membrane protein assembly factor BamB
MGLGNVYLTIQVTAPGGGPRAFTAYVVALDAQTGAERWRTAASSSTGVACTDPVFDQLNQLLYVGTTAGALVALEPTSGAVRWTYALDAGVHAAPALSGSQLCVGTDSGAVYLFDTANAAAAQAVNPVWRAQGPAEAAGTRVTTPLLADGLIYVITWVSDSGGIRVAPSTIEAGSGQLSTLASFSVTGASLDADFVPLPPVVGTHLFVGPNTPESAIFFNGYSDIQAVSLEGPAFDTFTIPDASLFFSSGIAQDPRDGSLYVGDSGGTLHVLDANLKPKRSVEAHDAIISTPVIDIDSGGQAAVYFGAFGPSSKLVWVLDPDSGNLVSIDTNQTSISLLSKRVANGVLYAAGNRPDPGASLAQVFALRVDTAVAAERAFIIESQLMQDYDEPTAGSLTSTARYQTHLTVVDDLKAPLGYEGLRIWAEAPTQVTIGGRSFSIDTRTPAVVQTEADGSLEIVSDATDMFATPLRVWATFMDPFERIVAYPDAEFHQRLAATVHDPTSDDPTTINLATARDYTNAPHNASGGTSLFSASEQPRAAQVATAIKTMSTAAGLDGPTVGRAPAVKGSAARADKYVAYPGDLPGTDYFPTDRSALRSISTPTPTAFSLNPDGSANEFSSLAVTDAAIAIDQLEGRDGMSALLQVGGISDWFKHLWDDIKKGFAKVTQFIVSVARDIYVGIQYVVNGITYAVKQIIRGIDDVAAAIGSFFVKLGKLIKNVIEAISIIFHFDRILDTQRVIEDFFSSNLGSLGSDINAAVPAVTTFLGRDESAMESDINAVINKIKGSLDAATLDRPAGAVASQSSGSGTAIAGLGQMGSTPHTIFSVAPVGDQRTQSHAVPCTWAMRKVSGNLKSVSSPATASLSDSNDPVSDFFATFLGTLQSDQTLNTAFAQTRADFEHTFRSMSVRNFLSMAVVDLLDVIKDLLIGAVAVVKALLAGLLEALGRGLSLLTDLGNLEIPIISSLYKALTGSPLTFIDLATFVAAIPITLLYRILDGKWPSQDSGVGAASGSPVMRRVAGLSTAIAYMFAGIVTAVLDAADIAASNQPLTARGPRMLGWKIAGAILLLGGIGATIFQGVEHTDFTGTDWVIWGTNLAALVVVLIVGGVGAVLPLTDAPLIGSMLNLILTVFQTYVVAGQFVSQEEKGDKPDVALFVAQLLLAVPMLVNPVKFFPAESLVPVVAPVSDVVFRLGAAGAYVADTVLEWSKL